MVLLSKVGGVPQWAVTGSGVVSGDALGAGRCGGRRPTPLTARNAIITEAK